MNWKIFSLKFDKKETWAFEQMSYLLFCAELKNRIGLFRYKNQTGIETEPIELEGKYCGFQAKYYTTSISDNKDDIIDSITKAKSKNSQLNELLFYINQEFSESSKKKEKKPQYQLDIEAAANELGINIQWRVPSHFEIQLALPENKYISDIFFSLDPNEGDLLDEISNHNENILQAIQTEIPFHGKEIKIDRTEIIENLKRASREKKNIIISGEGGCGKTSIFKEFYALRCAELPICIFKASELNVNHINEVFQFDHKYTSKQFLGAYQGEQVKYFVIDSAEKLAEITNSDILNSFIHELKKHGWNIIFTTRYAYLNDLIFHIRENYQLPFDLIDISVIGDEELGSISREFEFSLPNNQKFFERLRNLFYLREYINQYENIDKKGNFNSFIELLWKKRIQNNTYQKDNIHLQREKCIIDIAKKRYQTGRFYVNGDDLPQSALYQLQQDEILGYNDVYDGYFITHDIYEEWALDKIVTRCFSNYTSAEQFFDQLGDTLPIRRAFRLWLSDQLSDNSQQIQNFIKESVANNRVSPFWQDEILVSVMLSEYSETFFKSLEQEIVTDDFKILKRILFLLRIACTDISELENIEITKPKGNGWQHVIALIYKYEPDFFISNLKIVLPILSDWCEFNKEGKTTRYSGLLALSLIESSEAEEKFIFHDRAEADILRVIFNATKELKQELNVIFDKVIANKWTSHSSPYYGICTKILKEPYLATELIKMLPLPIIELCDLFWQKQPKKHERFGFDRDSIESHYGLTETYDLDYFPASANQTPLKWLLYAAFHNTLDFIISFTNRAVESYSQTDYGKEDVRQIKVWVNEENVSQYLSWAIWGMYRGNGSPVVPYLLQSMHMALEKVLLEFAQSLKSEIVRDILVKILTNSKSASLTSIVCSVVLANPYKFYDVALILFKSIELFHMDTIRSTNEFQAKSIYSIGYGLNSVKDTFYADERLKSCEDSHRSSNLESLILNYQIFGIQGFNETQNEEFINELYKIIDQHKVNDSLNQPFEMILTRMDRRNLSHKISAHTDDGFIVEFSPKELPEKLKKQSEQAQNEYEEFYRYSALKIWSDLVHNKTDNKSQKHKEYDDNPLLALSDTKDLVEELKAGRNAMEFMEDSIPASSCSKLMLDHIDLLSKEDKIFCKEIILSSVNRLFSDKYDYQIGDGVEASVNAIPILIREYPDQIEYYISILVMALLDETPIGNYKRICDYVIESIHRSKLWEQDHEVTQAILFGFINLKPSYKKIRTDKRSKQDCWGKIPKSAILEELVKTYGEHYFSNVPIDTMSIDSLDIHDLGIVYQLIPSKTKDKLHLEIYSKSLPLLVAELMKDRRSYKRDSCYDSNIHSTRRSIFKRCANFLLQREEGEISIFLQPFIDSLASTEETAFFLEEIVLAQDQLNRYEQFWYIWQSLYSEIRRLCDNPNGYDLEQVVINYLLAWKWWREGLDEWHSLKRDSLMIFENASKDMGHVPPVLYSIARLLNTVGAHFEDNGIDWIHNIVSKNNSLKLDDLESNTIYYLEKFIRKFVFLNRQRIKEEIRLKNKVIPILNFIIERGSVHGYLLRESIL